MNYSKDEPSIYRVETFDSVKDAERFINEYAAGGWKLHSIQSLSEAATCAAGLLVVMVNVGAARLTS